MAAYRGILSFFLVLAAYACIASAQDKLITVCYGDAAPLWTAYLLDPTSGSLSTYSTLDLDTSALINLTLQNNGNVGVHFHQYLHLSFSYSGGFGQGTRIRQLANNAGVSHIEDINYPFFSGGGFTGDCEGNFYLTDSNSGYVQEVQFNPATPTAQLQFVRVLDTEILAMPQYGGQYFWSMFDSTVPDPQSSSPTDTAYLTTLIRSNSASTVSYLTGKNTESSYLDGLEADPTGSKLFRLTYNSGAPGITTYTVNPFAFVSTNSLSPPYTTCIGVAYKNAHLCSNSVSSFTGGATGTNGVLLGRRKL